MLIRLGYDLQFRIPAPLAFVAQLRIHPKHHAALLEPDAVRIEHSAGPVDSFEYIDSYGNICTRFLAPAGYLKLWNSTLIEDSGEVDPVNLDAREIPPHELPNDVLRFLLASRYCEVDQLSAIAVDLFGNIPPGWGRVQAICDWVHNKVTFNYGMTRPTKTALDVFTERVGVCRDFQHLV
jgi:transglutaminase-like putative cysteine protease